MKWKLFWFVHEIPDVLRDFIGGGVEREVAGGDDMNIGGRDIALIGPGFRDIERGVVLFPDDEQAGLRLLHRMIAMIKATQLLFPEIIRFIFPASMPNVSRC